MFDNMNLIQRLIDQFVEEFPQLKKLNNDHLNFFMKYYFQEIY